MLCFPLQSDSAARVVTRLHVAMRAPMSSEIPPMSCPTTIGRGEDPCAHNDAYIHFAAKFRKEFGAVCDCCAACRAPGERGAGVRRRTADGGTYAYRTQTSVTSQTEHFALTAVGPRAYKSSRYD